VPVVVVRRRTRAAGGAANVAANVAALGATALLGGIVGGDPQGRQFLRALEKSGGRADGLVRVADRPTIVKTRLLANGQPIVRIDRERRSPAPAQAEESLLDWIGQMLPEVDACILSDYGKGVVSERLASRLIGAARRLGRPVVVDPKGTDYGKYRGATVVKPNLHEVERLLHEEIAEEADLLRAGNRLAAQLDGTAVLIKRGAWGMSLFRADALPLHRPAATRRVRDVTGAEDTVVAVLALILAAGAELEDAAAAWSAVSALRKRRRRR
jgi:D-glycero-beta-D-manno-heptose-7-phosphate kinase